jgi:hypothetical protein
MLLRQELCSMHYKFGSADVAFREMLSAYGLDLDKSPDDAFCIFRLTAISKRLAAKAKTVQQSNNNDIQSYILALDNVVLCSTDNALHNCVHHHFASTSTVATAFEIEGFDHTRYDKVTKWASKSHEARAKFHCNLYTALRSYWLRWQFSHKELFDVLKDVFVLNFHLPFSRTSKRAFGIDSIEERMSAIRSGRATKHERHVLARAIAMLRTVICLCSRH